MHSEQFAMPLASHSAAHPAVPGDALHRAHSATVPSESRVHSTESIGAFHPAHPAAPHANAREHSTSPNNLFKSVPSTIPPLYPTRHQAPPDGAPHSSHSTLPHPGFREHSTEQRSVFNSTSSVEHPVNHTSHPTEKNAAMHRAHSTLSHEGFRLHTTEPNGVLNSTPSATLPANLASHPAQQDNELRRAHSALPSGDRVRSAELTADLNGAHSVMGGTSQDIQTSLQKSAAQCTHNGNATVSTPPPLPPRVPFSEEGSLGRSEGDSASCSRTSSFSYAGTSTSSMAKCGGVKGDGKKPTNPFESVASMSGGLMQPPPTPGDWENLIKSMMHPKVRDALRDAVSSNPGPFDDTRHTLQRLLRDSGLQDSYHNIFQLQGERNEVLEVHLVEDGGSNVYVKLGSMVSWTV